MNYNIEESNLLDKLKELEIDIPVSLTFLPENISEASNKSDFIFADSTTDFKKLFRLNELGATELNFDPKSSLFADTIQSCQKHNYK